MKVSSYYHKIANSYNQWNAAVENPIKGVGFEIVEGWFELVLAGGILLHRVVQVEG